MNAHGNCLKNYEIFCYSTFYMNKENNIREKKKFLIYFVKKNIIRTFEKSIPFMKTLMNISNRNNIRILIIMMIIKLKKFK
ncbi:hypothetical protein C923_04332 [Plasmodium falciparum UGT5.1]|uniref:Uncharacterized protein n=2 Tax=Plasmodium falciparum TaxID=5833 RepID=A0A024WMT6_PLAFA|nr:hypothetical protein PFMALIP_04098 [Plasmodium falciparum MaliPS096_E11]EWC75006.1 hypothetical protein C923_04332 [Plasmodium falciparum UGT5.1]